MRPAIHARAVEKGGYSYQVGWERGNPIVEHLARLLNAG